MCQIEGTLFYNSKSLSVPTFYYKWYLSTIYRVLYTFPDRFPSKILNQFYLCIFEILNQTKLSGSIITNDHGLQHATLFSCWLGDRSNAGTTVFNYQTIVVFLLSTSKGLNSEWTIPSQESNSGPVTCKRDALTMKLLGISQFTL